MSPIKKLLLFLALAATAWATPADREIEHLLHYLGSLDGAVFIRNGSEHTATEAEAHVRMKWDKQSDRIHTAEEFIKACASQSSMSGKRYEIRLKDGRQISADDLLRAELARIRAAEKK